MYKRSELPITPNEARTLERQIREQVTSQVLGSSTAGRPGVHVVGVNSDRLSPKSIVWIQGALFLWSISYERCEELWVGPGEDVFGGKFEMLALGANALRESQDGVALVSVRVAVAQDQVGAAVLGPELSKLVHLISRCELAPELIHELEQSWGGSTALNEAPFLQSQFEDGWAAHAPSERKEPCRCSRGIVHPFHFDMRGHCRCDSNATFHKPLLRHWLRT
jgi:hypothetical protein